jgi:acetyl esterase/lipase
MARTKCVLSRRSALGIFGGAAAAVVTGCNEGVPPAHGQGDGTRYQYGQEPSQYAEISLPAGTAPAPVVVIVHGGYWQAGYGLELGRPLAADVAGRGFAAVNVEYRRIGDGGGWPQTGQDVAAAVDALKDQAQGRLDLNHVVGLGHSAGGQLTGWLASKRDAAVPLTGVVLQAGVLDLVRGADEGLGGGAVEEFLGGSPTERADAYAQASPIGLVPVGVPSVCVHGTADRLVPIEQSERFVAAAGRAGDRSELRTFDGDHFQPITVGTPAWELCVEGLRRLTGV